MFMVNKDYQKSETPRTDGRYRRAAMSCITEIWDLSRMRLGILRFPLNVSPCLTT